MPFLSLSMNNSNYQEEIPITSTPIFEGHLYIRTIKKQWQWRLFRFDGSSFTCLSTKKVKTLPQSVQDASLLLMTPKDKEKRLIQDEKLELKYYQLPEWTIDITNISSISILKRKKHSNQVSKCFSIRTFDSNQFILKAQKQKDLERWLFVLTKMWKFTQTIQDHIQQYYIPQPAIPIQQVEQEQIQLEKENDIVDDNTPLVHSMNNKPTQTLSSEKIKVIEEWRKSLAELMANDPTIRITTPPPIEPIPDDDTMSIFSDMTSVSKRPKNNTMIKRKTSKRSTATNRSLRRNKSNSISPSSKELPLEGRPTLKKKRSDDVRNWMNDKRKDKLVSQIQIDPLNQHDHCSTSPEIVQYMNFFQDALTTCDDESCPYEHHPQHASNKLKYHTSVRGKKLIQVNQGDESNRRSRFYEEGDETERGDQEVIKKKNSVAIHREGDDFNQNTCISKQPTRRASIPLMNQVNVNMLQKEQQHLLLQQQQQLQQQQYLFDQQKMNLLSPLQFLSLTGTSYNINQQEEEEMSLADLQKSLRQVSINNHQQYHPSYYHHTRSPSASSIHDNYVQQYPSSIVAPAIPPHQYHRPSSFYDYNYQQYQQFNNNLLISSSCPTTVRKKK